MKKILLSLLFISLSFSAVVEYTTPPRIRSTVGTIRNGGYQEIHLEVKAQAIVSPASTITWYADNIGGFSGISLQGLDVATGNATTVSAQAVYANGVAVKGCNPQVLTSGSPTTSILSPYYKFIYNTNGAGLTINATDRNTVTFNFYVYD